MEIISKSQLKREIIQGKYSECELASTLFEQFKLISSLKNDLDITEKALKLACDELRNLNYRTFDNADINFEQQFKEEVKYKLKRE